MKRLIPKSRFTGKQSTVDSVKSRIKRQGDKTNLPLFSRAQQAWMDNEPVRKTALRNLRYVTGDQWSDYVLNERGEWEQERKRIERRNNGVALQNNHLFKIVNAMTSHYDAMNTTPTVHALKEDADEKSQMMTRTLRTNWNRNEMSDLLSTEMFNFICYGVALAKEEWTCVAGIEDSYTTLVSLMNAFWEMEGGDPRHWDISMIGEFKDYTLGELSSRMANSEYDYRQLEEIYKPYLGAYSDYYNSNRSKKEVEEPSFNKPNNDKLCRVYEIWTKEYRPCIRCKDIMDEESPLYNISPDQLYIVEEENNRRLAQGLAQGMAREDIPLIEYSKKDHPRLGYHIEEYWHYQALAPDGRVLEEYDSPYEHGEHPYTIKMHLYTEGKIIPVISIPIDQQRYVNRLYTLGDMMMTSTIKGLKMIPKDCVPKNMSEREFAERATEIGGWIFYEPSKTGAMPQVITQNSSDMGISQLLQLQLQAISDESSVSDAMQGKAPASGTSAARYMMETENSKKSASTMYKKFNQFETNLARKKLKTIHQYYNEPRNISTEQMNGFIKYEMYDPIAVRDIDFDVRITHGVDTPTARIENNERLENWAANGWITFDDMLSNGYYPQLQDLKQQRAALMERAEKEGMLSPQGEAVQGGAPQAGSAPSAGYIKQLEDILKS